MKNHKTLLLAVLLHLMLIGSNVSASTSGSSYSEGSNSNDNQYLSSYYEQRSKLVKDDQELAIGSTVYFTTQEEQANSIFEQIVLNDELTYSNIDPPSYNTLYEASTIQNMETFKILQKFPKGSALHLHQDSSATYDYLIQVGTYLPNCYYYIGQANANFSYGSYYFFDEQPDDGDWVLLETVRSQQANVTEFDNQLYLNLTLIGRDTGDYVELWRNFDSIFSKTSGLVTYVPIAEGYLQHMIDQMIGDNIQHVELRKPFATYYNLNGTTYNDTWYIELVERLVKENQQKYNMPCFNVKIIGADFRHNPKDVVMKHLQESLVLRNQYPYTFIGFDLDGPEDLGYPLIYYIDEFAAIYEAGIDQYYSLDYYFHAGETILYNNTNLYDAILLNSQRIGHGFSIQRYPVLMEVLIEKNIGLEICPISNQVLEFYTNIRSHPVASLMNSGVTVTISSDDPAIYGYAGTSLDFFEVVFSAGLNLKQLKQLALNSLDQSAFYDDTERDLNYAQWESSWKEFVSYIITTYSQ
ncbi:adenosine deaminase-related growth factor [Tieghemostelium lacteum]|uniref:adenosine deaminase n=1 Tax=Tieghemostelium lacteum TaxID=361077 RepID=A0A152A9V0_TIELA|nr:adenosine deaminase-related growth factor [Tieghemostelium lacteum]|eukprot:KYR02996.1 adenosine deaminase-related growth factor [Tieghemostelium lacteum]